VCRKSMVSLIRAQGAESPPHHEACGASRGVTQRILYGGRWWLPLSPGRGESNESKVARDLSQHQMSAK